MTTDVRIDTSSLTDTELRALATPEMITEARKRCCDGCKAPDLYCDAACSAIFAGAVDEAVNGQAGS